MKQKYAKPEGWGKTKSASMKAYWADKKIYASREECNRQSVKNWQSKKKKIGINLDPDKYEQVKSHAKSKGLSLQDLVVGLLDKELAQ